MTAINEYGNDEHRKVLAEIEASDMLLRVQPVSRLKASGVTGLINPVVTNLRVARNRLSRREALGEIYIAIAAETIDNGGQRGCEGTLVHEGRHAYDFAQMIASISNADVSPLSVFNPTLYELEWEAHRAAGDYMLRVGKDEYIEEGIQLMILANAPDGTCFLDEQGIRNRLRDSYGLDAEGPQGRRASELLGLMI